MSECFCGVCGPCRRTMRAEQVSMKSSAPAQLGPLAKRIMDERYNPEAIPVTSHKEEPSEPRKRSSPGLYTGEDGRKKPANHLTKPRTDALRKYEAENRGKMMQRRRDSVRMIDGRKVQTDPRPEHGKQQTYRAWYCRCLECSAANTEEVRKYRAGRKKREQQGA